RPTRSPGGNTGSAAAPVVASAKARSARAHIVRKRLMGRPAARAEGGGDCRMRSRLGTTLNAGSLLFLGRPTPGKGLTGWEAADASRRPPHGARWPWCACRTTARQAEVTAP